MGVSRIEDGGEGETGLTEEKTEEKPSRLHRRQRGSSSSGSAALITGSPDWLNVQHQIKKKFKEIGVLADVKYIDPTYMIRACRANASDAILCTVLGQKPVHGAFAGYSGISVGICNSHYVYLPIPEVITSPSCVNPNSRMWHWCLTSAGQPDFY